MGVGVFQAFDAAHIADKVFPAVALYLLPLFIRKVYDPIYGNQLLFKQIERGNSENYKFPLYSV